MTWELNGFWCEDIVTLYFKVKFSPDAIVLVCLIYGDGGCKTWKGKRDFFTGGGPAWLPAVVLRLFFRCLFARDMPICTRLVSRHYASKETNRHKCLIVNDNAEKKRLFCGLIAGNEAIYGKITQYWAIFLLNLDAKWRDTWHNKTM